jgi:hypothetical protein
VKRILSFGGGVNSTAILVGLHERAESLDLILFADTGSEKPHTYAHLATMSEWCRWRGFPTITVIKPYQPQQIIDGSLGNECLRLVLGHPAGARPARWRGFQAIEGRNPQPSPITSTAGEYGPQQAVFAPDRGGRQDARLRIAPVGDVGRRNVGETTCRERQIADELRQPHLLPLSTFVFWRNLSRVPLERLLDRSRGDRARAAGYLVLALVRPFDCLRLRRECGRLADASSLDLDPPCLAPFAKPCHLGVRLASAEVERIGEKWRVVAAS